MDQLRMRNYSGPAHVALHHDYNDMEFYPLPLKKEDKIENLMTSLTVPGNHNHYYEQGYVDPLKDFELNPPPPPPAPMNDPYPYELTSEGGEEGNGREEVSLEDIMALVDPGLSVSNSQNTVYQHRLVERHQSAPLEYATQPSKLLHQALTKPRPSLPELPPTRALVEPPPVVQQRPSSSIAASHPPIVCSKCHEELSSKCLVQACVSPSVIERHRSQETKCRDCGNELSAKCILAMCKAKAVKVTH